jgi:hypothetical protein
MSSILAIDPGPTESAWVVYHHGRPVAFAKEPNAVVLDRVDTAGYDYPHVDLLAIESIASYGMPVGAEVFETCVWSGRFIQAWAHWHGEDFARVYRRDVKLHLCGSARAKDANVRQALIDHYGPGKGIAIGRKASPGPLYGVTADVWAALAVAVAVDETNDAPTGDASHDQGPIKEPGGRTINDGSQGSPEARVARGARLDDGREDR